VSDAEGPEGPEGPEINPALRERAQILLDLIAPAGVPPAVADEFLRDLAAIVGAAVEGAVDREREREQDEARGRWFQAGLGGARWRVVYPSQEAAAEAVAYLMSHGHGHHFAVVEEGTAVLMSRMATDCLNTHQRDQTRERAVQAAARGSAREARRGPDLGDDPDGDIEGADFR